MNCQAILNRLNLLRHKLAGKSQTLAVPVMQPNGDSLKPCQGDLMSLFKIKYFGDVEPRNPNKIQQLICPDCDEKSGHHKESERAKLKVWHEGGAQIRKVRLVYHAQHASWSTAAYAGSHKAHKIDEETTQYLASLGEGINFPLRVTGDLFQQLRSLSEGEDITEELKETAIACRWNGAWAFAWQGVLYDCTGTRDAYSYGIDLDGHLRQIAKLDAGVMLNEAFYNVSPCRTVLAYVVLILSITAIAWQIVDEGLGGLSGVLEAIGNVILLLGLLKYLVSNFIRDVQDAKRLLLGYARMEELPVPVQDLVCLANYEGLSASTDGANISYSDASFISDWAARSEPVRARDLTSAGWLVLDTFAISPRGLIFRVDATGGVLRITRETVRKPTGILYPDALVGG